MASVENSSYTVFAGHKHIATGTLREVAGAAKELVDQGEQQLIVIFDDETGKVIDLDYRGTMEEFVARIEAPVEAQEPPQPANTKRGPGRPKLGVVSREVTLLPRHWEWLAGQPGGASVTLRKLVEKAMRDGRHADLARRLHEGAYRFMSFMAGDFPGFEEASRAFFAHDYSRFTQLIHQWPGDVREHTLRLVRRVQQAEAQAVEKPSK